MTYFLFFLLGAVSGIVSLLLLMYFNLPDNLDNSPEPWSK